MDHSMDNPYAEITLILCSTELCWTTDFAAEGASPSTTSISLQASKAAKGGQGFHASMPRRGDEDTADITTRCSTVQLAWLDLLQDLTGFFTKELKLLMSLCVSPELSEFYKVNQQLSAWESGVKNMRNVLTEVRCTPQCH